MNDHRSRVLARVVLAAVTLLTVVTTAQPAPKPTLEFKIEKGTGEDAGKLFVSATCEETNALVFLGALLQAVKDDGSIPVPKVRLQLRDTSVGLEPRKICYTADDLIAYHRTGKLPDNRGALELELVKRSGFFSINVDKCELMTLIGYACMGIGLERHVWRGTIHILPPEELGGHARTVGRRAYRLPEGHTWQKADKLPRRLGRCGACCAYDPTTRLLNIIGEDFSLNSFEHVLEALGAVCVWESEVVTW